jgi:hypothetical protein
MDVIYSDVSQATSRPFEMPRSQRFDEPIRVLCRCDGGLLRCAVTLEHDEPQLYEVMRDFFGQDPTARTRREVLP